MQVKRSEKRKEGRNKLPKQGERKERTSQNEEIGSKSYFESPKSGLNITNYLKTNLQKKSTKKKKTFAAPSQIHPDKPTKETAWKYHRTGK